MPSPLPPHEILMSCTNIYRLKWGKILLMLEATGCRSESSRSAEAVLPTCTSACHNVTTTALEQAANLESCYLQGKTNNGRKRAVVTIEAATSGPLSTKRTCWIKVAAIIKMKSASLLLSSVSLSCSALHSSGMCPSTEAGSSHDDISFVALGDMSPSENPVCFFLPEPERRIWWERHTESRLRTLTCPDMQRRIAVGSLVTWAEVTVVSTSSH